MLTGRLRLFILRATPGFGDGCALVTLFVSLSWLAWVWETHTRGGSFLKGAGELRTGAAWAPDLVFSVRDGPPTSARGATLHRDESVVRCLGCTPTSAGSAQCGGLRPPASTPKRQCNHHATSRCRPLVTTHRNPGSADQALESEERRQGCASTRYRRCYGDRVLCQLKRRN